ncbi:hypothetical protein [Dietzia psychralcaliphila]|uniref:hypothetical protein n=1 Tax=Dietzia psychralcaliphila TaxID=139021 RepID=UPI0013A57FD0|nr:hypothetical protein [Dietzia psychralcaliphila]
MAWKRNLGRDTDRADYKRVIRFFPDYGRDHPLWESETDKYGMDPEDYGPVEVGWGQRLARWMAHWETNFVPETGWKSEQAAGGLETCGRLAVWKTCVGKSPTLPKCVMNGGV